MDGFHGLLIRADELIINGEKLDAARCALGVDCRAKTDVGRANHHARGALGCEIVQRGDDFFAIRGANLDQLKAIFVSRLLGKFPFQLKPRLLGLLDDKSDAHLIWLMVATRQQKQRRHRQKTEDPFHVFTFTSRGV